MWILLFLSHECNECKPFDPIWLVDGFGPYEPFKPTQLFSEFCAL